MIPYSVEIFSGYEAFENRPVLTLQEDNRRTTAKFESVWTHPYGRTSVPMNVSCLASLLPPCSQGTIAPGVIDLLVRVWRVL
jgi:hypothetical protein